MAHHADFSGIKNFSSVIDSLERRYLKNQSAPEEEEDAGGEAVDAGGEDAKSKKKKAKAKKWKPTKEEEEWMREGEGFIDDSEVLMDDEPDDEDADDGASVGADSLEGIEKPNSDPVAARSKFIAIRLERTALEAAQNSLPFSIESQSRVRFLAEHLDDWVPPLDVQHKLFALEQEVTRSFETPKDWAMRRQKGLGRIEVHLLRVDRAARRALSSNGGRSPGYIAKLVNAFPSPFTRGKVVAHLQRVLLSRSLKDKERRLKELAKDAVETMKIRLNSIHGVKDPPPPNISLAGLPDLDLSPLERDGGPMDDDAINTLDKITDDVTLKPVSIDTLKSLLRAVELWGESHLPPHGEPPHDAYVACRDALEAVLKTDKYFVWDGATRSAVWNVGEACLACAKARAKLDAWVVERRMDLVVGGGKGPVKNFRPKQKFLRDYLVEAEEGLIDQVFRATILPGLTPSEMLVMAKGAMIIRAMCECPADYYFVNDRGDFQIPKPIGQEPVAIPESGATTIEESGGSSAAINSLSLDQSIDSITSAPAHSKHGTAGNVIVRSSSTATEATQPNQNSVSGKVAITSPTGGDKAIFFPSKGTRFQRVTFQMEDFEVGEFVSQHEIDQDHKESAKDGGADRRKPGPVPGSRKKKKEEAAMTTVSVVEGNVDEPVQENNKKLKMDPNTEGTQINQAAAELETSQ